jgi:hypothetical protein
LDAYLLSDKELAVSLACDLASVPGGPLKGARSPTHMCMVAMETEPCFIFPRSLVEDISKRHREFIRNSPLLGMLLRQKIKRSLREAGVAATRKERR